MKEESGLKEVPEKMRKWWTISALAIAVIVAALGIVAVFGLTGYESLDTVTLATPAGGNELTFVVHLRTEGPFSTYKHVTVLNVQVLGVPERDMHRISLGLHGGRWFINTTRDVDYRAGEMLGPTFWTGRESDGFTEFLEEGDHQVMATIWTDAYGYGSIGPYAGEGPAAANVTVLPKESDILWQGTRASAVGIVLGVAFVAGPEALKDFRDLWYGLH